VKQEYINELKEVMTSWRTNYPNGYIGEQNWGYINGHLQVFTTGFDFIESLKLGENKKALELASPFPYYTYFLWKEKHWLIKCVDIQLRDHLLEGTKIYMSYGNIYESDLGKELWDLITFCNMWSHVGDNLYKIRDKILKSLKKGGYFLTSFPLGGVRTDIKEWDKILKLEDFRTHQRMFTEETSRMLIELPMLQEATVTTSWFGPIKVILYKKE